MEVDNDFIELAIDMASAKDKRIELKDYHQDYGNASALFPRTRSEIMFSTVHGRLTLDFFRIEHLTKFEISSRLSGQLGIWGSKKGNLSHIEIAPKLNFAVTPRFTLEMLYGKNTSGLGCFYKFTERLSAGFFTGMTRDQTYFDFEARFDYSKTSKFCLGFDNYLGDFLFSYTKKFNSGSVSVYLKQYPLEFFVHGFRGKVKVLKDLSFLYSSELTEAGVKKQSLGVQVRLGEHLKLENSIQKHLNSVIWVLGLKRGGFSLSFPVRIQKVSSFFSVFGVCLFAYVARGVFRAFFQGNSDKKVEKQKEFSVKFIQMVEAKVKENMQAEEMKNGLVVTRGLFGREEDILESLVNGAQGRFIDVTIALNFMVDESKLKIPCQPKESLQGFYFVCESPKLFIEYQLRGETSRVFIENTQELIIS